MFPQHFFFLSTWLLVIVSVSSPLSSPVSLALPLSLVFVSARLWHVQVGYVFGKGGNTIADVKSKAGVNISTDVSPIANEVFLVHLPTSCMFAKRHRRLLP